MKPDYNYYTSQWASVLPRGELQRLLFESRRLIPALLKPYFKAGASPLDLLDSYVDSVLSASRALSDEVGCQTSLTALCNYLDVDVRHLSGRLSSRRVGLRMVDDGFWRGTLRRVGNRWEIVVGPKSLPASRFAAAHELGHVLLYARHGHRAETFWRLHEWSVYEEAVVNYIARRLLMPAALCGSVAAGGNIAEQIVSVIQAKANAPQEAAAVRWLDVDSPDASQSYAILITTQYDPWSEPFLRRSTYNVKSLKNSLCAFAEEAFRHVPAASWAQRLALWKWLLDIDCEMEDAYPWQVRFDRLAELPSRALNDIQALPHEVRVKVIAALGGDDIRKTFYYRWIVWRERPSLPCYVPLARGTLKADSQAALLAGRGPGPTVSIDKEQVKIGAFEGSYEFHGFAHGDSSKGTRYVVQVACL